MLARRIYNIDDITRIYKGMRSGMLSGSFTERDLMEIMAIIVDKNTTFWIFEDRDKVVGFGSIKERNEVAKVFVIEEFRQRGYGKCISLWLKKRILGDGLVPILWVKNTNKWKNAQAEMGMIKIIGDSYGETSKYMLMDFEKYVEALRKYKIGEIEVKKSRTNVEDASVYLRFRDRLNLIGRE